nr:DUF302 domain-containing protein [uncultured Roseovarius sp.]
MKRLITAIALIWMAAPALAMSDDIVKVKSAQDVAATMDALEAAVTGAGATVFARVDHAAGAASVDMALDPAQLLIFGNPKLGTPAIQDDALAGIYLPLRVLVYRDGAGQVWLAYEDPKAMLSGLGGVVPDSGYIAKMTGALGKLTGKASGM